MASCARVLLKEKLVENKKKVDEWFFERKNSISAEFIPFYTSYDIRDADYKIAPVDANLFPAGFNNICSDDLEDSMSLIQGTFKQILGKVPEKILILPENHTRNRFYIENLYELRLAFQRAGIQTEVGWYDPQMSDAKISLFTPDETEIQAYPIQINNGLISIEGFQPEAIVINNDYSDGFPEILKSVKQPLLPSPKLGWHSRRKDIFFEFYNSKVLEFTKDIGIDPWVFSVQTKKVNGVDFDTGTGMDTVIQTVEQSLAEIKRLHKEHSIQQEPFVFIKNNAGTYGIGIMKVHHASELEKLNRREKNKMSTGKGNKKISEIIVQEGIPTRFKVESAWAEPVIYMVGEHLFGGFLRKNPNRSELENLNSQGMVFQKLCMADLRRETDRDLELELVYGTIAKISFLAVSEEIKFYQEQWKMK